MRRRLSSVGQWLRAERLGVPRWFLGFAILFAVALTSVLAFAWGR